MRILERESELELLERAVEEACRWRGSVVLASGEAGIGKTSIVRLLRDLSVGRVRLAVGRCEPLSVPEPLGPLRDIAIVVPGIGPALAGCDAPGVARALCAACTEPMVVVVEDAHWADGLTLDAVRLVARRAEELPLVLLVTCRDDELSPDHPLRALAADLAAAPGVIRLPLHRLSLDAVADLAEQRGGDADRVFRLTAGNPFLVVELLDAGGELPASVRDAALARVSRLSPEGRSALTAAAAIGGSIPLALLREISGVSPVEIEECLTLGILIDDGRSLAFRHELIRQAVEETTPTVRREQLHAAIAARLVAEPAPLDHGRIAHYAALAGNRPLAVEHAVAAGARARAAGAPNEATALFDLALANLDADAAVARAYVLTELGAARWLGGRDAAGSAAVLREAAELYAAIGDDLGRGRALRYLCRVCWMLDRWDEAEQAITESIDLLERCDDAEELALALSWMTGNLALRHDHARLRQLAPRALEAADLAGSQAARVAVEISVALVDGLEGDATSLERFQQAIADARRCGDLHQQVRAFVNALVVASLQRRHDFVDRWYPEAEQLFEERGLDAPLDDVTQSLGQSMLDRGNLHEAARRGRLAHRVVQVESVVSTALEALALGRLGTPGAWSMAEAALTQVVGDPDGYREGVLRAACAELSWLNGDHDAGRSHARAGLSLPAIVEIQAVEASLAIWGFRCGCGPDELPSLAGPVGDELVGDWAAARRGWQSLDAPYEAALATLPGDPTTAAKGYRELLAIDAQAAALAFTRERAAAGLSVPRGPRGATAADPAGLTTRERQVLALVAEGMTNGQIGEHLVLSERTVSHHVSSLMHKLGANTRTEAVARSASLTAQDGTAGSPI